MPEGFHCTRAFVTNPNTGEAIGESSSRERCFVVYTEGEYHARAQATPLLGSSEAAVAADVVSNGGGGGPGPQNVDDLLPYAKYIVVSLDLNGHKGLGPLQTHNLPVQRFGDAHYHKVGALSLQYIYRADLPIRHHL